MIDRDEKNCSSSLIIREVQIKTTLIYNLTHMRMGHIKKTRAIVGENVEEKELLFTVGGN